MRYSSLLQLWSNGSHNSICFLPAYFLHSSLEAASSFLARQFESQNEAYELALQTDPLADIDDFLTFTALPEPAQDKLNERHEWVKNVWKVSSKLFSHPSEPAKTDSDRTGRRKVDEMERSENEG